MQITDIAILFISVVCFGMLAILFVNLCRLGSKKRRKSGSGKITKRTQSKVLKGSVTGEQTDLVEKKRFEHANKANRQSRMQRQPQKRGTVKPMNTRPF